MRKIKLHVIGNFGNFNYYIFDKKQKVVEKLSALFYRVFKLDLDLYKDYQDKKGKWIRRKITFEGYRDFHEHDVGLKDNRMDLFFGDKKVFVIIHCDDKLRLKFNKELSKTSLMSNLKN